MAWAVPLELVSVVLIWSTKLLAITAPSPAVLTATPIAAPVVIAFLSVKPSILTIAALIRMTGLAPMGFAPFTVDSEGPPDTRRATEVPACAPLRVRVLVIVTFSKYVPGATLIGLQV